MAKALLLVLVIAAAGCAWPSKTHPWCAPHAKANLHKQSAWAGVRCDW
jgi:hypothetical protein